MITSTEKAVVITPGNSDQAVPAYLYTLIETLVGGKTGSGHNSPQDFASSPANNDGRMRIHIEVKRVNGIKNYQIALQIHHPTLGKRSMGAQIRRLRFASDIRRTMAIFGEMLGEEAQLTEKYRSLLQIGNLYQIERIFTPQDHDIKKVIETLKSIKPNRHLVDIVVERMKGPFTSLERVQAWVSFLRGLPHFPTDPALKHYAGTISSTFSPEESIEILARNLDYLPSLQAYLRLAEETEAVALPDRLGLLYEKIHQFPKAAFLKEHLVKAQLENQDKAGAERTLDSLGERSVFKHQKTCELQLRRQEYAAAAQECRWLLKNVPNGNYQTIRQVLAENPPRASKASNFFVASHLDHAEPREPFSYEAYAAILAILERPQEAQSILEFLLRQDRGQSEDYNRWFYQYASLRPETLTELNDKERLIAWQKSFPKVGILEAKVAITAHETHDNALFSQHIAAARRKTWEYPHVQKTLRQLARAAV